MYEISTNVVLQLIAKVKGIKLPINECLLPFGCKLAFNNNKYYIKYYAYDKSDLNQLIQKFPFIELD